MTLCVFKHYTAKQSQHIHSIFLLSGFTYLNISNQNKWLHKAVYQLTKLTQSVLGTSAFERRGDIWPVTLISALAAEKLIYN